jgi:hypothetical protein
MVKGEELVGSTDQLRQQARCRITDAIRGLTCVFFIIIFINTILIIFNFILIFLSTFVRNWRLVYFQYKFPIIKMFHVCA